MKYECPICHLSRDSQIARLATKEIVVTLTLVFGIDGIYLSPGGREVFFKNQARLVLNEECDFCDLENTLHFAKRHLR